MAKEANEAARAAVERQAREVAAAAANKAEAATERAAAEVARRSATTAQTRTHKDADTQTDQATVVGLFDVPCPMCKGEKVNTYDDSCCTMCNGSGVAP